MDIYCLSHLQNLAILDLKGNEVTIKVADYRLYAIFCVRSLRMLDGQSIRENDIKKAQVAYDGRLHRDFLLDYRKTATIVPP